MSNQATGNFAHQPREGFMAPTFRIFVRTAEGAEFQAFTWCRDEASGIAPPQTTLSIQGGSRSCGVSAIFVVERANPRAHPGQAAHDEH